MVDWFSQTAKYVLLYFETVRYDPIQNIYAICISNTKHMVYQLNRLTIVFVYQIHSCIYFIRTTIHYELKSTAIAFAKNQLCELFEIRNRLYYKLSQAYHTISVLGSIFTKEGINIFGI